MPSMYISLFLTGGIDVSLVIFARVSVVFIIGSVFWVGRSIKNGATMNGPMNAPRDHKL